ncbi:MAG: hypothetical protein CSA22_01440 [Deltaproteobacteria bacterium]|nr:MAG: hypothetical protein CSA22_01440 [Deltaproteobacteria bacterium]
MTHTGRHRICLFVFLLLIMGVSSGGYLRHLFVGDTSASKADETVSVNSGLSLACIRQIISDADTAAADTFGLRDVWIRAYAEISWFLFRSPLSPKVVRGAGDVLYYGETLHGRPGADTFYTSMIMQAWADRISHRKALADCQGARYGFAVIPDKVTIWPLYTADLQQPPPGDRLRETVAARGLGRDFLYLKDPLVRADACEKTFYRTDTHWTHYGGWVGVSALIAHFFPDRTAAQMQPDFVNTTYRSGDLVRLMSLTGRIRESAPHVSRTDAYAENSVRQPVSGIPEPDQEMLAPFALSGSGDGTLLVISDSFFMDPDRMAAHFLAPGFSTSLYVHRLVVTDALYQKLLNRFQPDYVIEIMVERALFRGLDLVQTNLRNAALAKRYSRADTTLFNLTPATIRFLKLPGQGVQVKSDLQTNRIHIQGKRETGWIEVPVPAPVSGEVVVKLDLATDHPRYLRMEARTPAGVQSMSRFIRSDRSGPVYFRFKPGSQPVASIRLYPHAVETDLVLRTVSARCRKTG